MVEQLLSNDSPSQSPPRLFLHHFFVVRRLIIGGASVVRDAIVDIDRSDVVRVLIGLVVRIIVLTKRYKI